MQRFTTLLSILGALSLSTGCQIYIEGYDDDDDYGDGWGGDPTPEPPLPPFPPEPPVPPDPPNPPGPPGDCGAVTLDPSFAQENITISDDGLSAKTSENSTNDSVFATVGKTSGKWYYETRIELGGDGYTAVGISPMHDDWFQLEVQAGAVGPGCGITGGVLITCNGEPLFNPSLPGLNEGDVVGVAFDLDAHLVYFSVNGQWLEGQDPAAGIGGLSTGYDPSYPVFYPLITLDTYDLLTANFAGPFAWEVPPGFAAYSAGTCNPDPGPGCESNVTLDANAAQENISLSADALSAATSDDSTNDSVFATVGKTSGKWYYETRVEVGGDGYTAAGISALHDDFIQLEMWAGSVGPGCGITGGGLITCNGEPLSGQIAPNLQEGDIIGVAFDLDAQLVYFSVNGQWLEGQDPAAGIGGLSTGSDPSYPVFYPLITLSTGDVLSASFAGPFAWEIPPGFAAYGGGDCNPNPQVCGISLDPNNAQENLVLSEDLLSVQTSGDSTNDSVVATVGKTSGKWYYETRIDVGSDGYTSIGVASVISLEVGPGDLGPGCGLGGYGWLRCNGLGTQANFASLQAGDTVGVAFDLDARLVYFSVNGQWLPGQDPAAGIGGFDLGYEPGFEEYYPVITLSTGDVLSASFAGPFAWEIPPGFAAYDSCQ